MHSARMSCPLLLCFLWISTGVVYAQTDSTNTEAQAAECTFDWNITNSQEQTLIVEWSDVGIGNVTVTLKEICSQLNVTENFSTNQAELKPWSNNTEYAVEITFNCSSSGEDKRAKTIWTPPASPSDIKPINRTDTSITLQWKSPPGPGKIELYRLVVNDSLPLVETPNETITIIQLKAYTAYEVKVAAKNPDFWGWMSEKVQVRTASGVPGVPRNFRNTSTTNTSIYLEWDKLDPLTGPIVNYMVCCDNCTSPETNTTDIFLNITDLQPYKEYRLKVRAYTETAPGQWSEEKVIRTLTGVPDVPRNFRNISTTNTSIYLEWDELDPSTGPIVSYTVSCDPCTTRETNTTDVFLNITSLQPYTEHRVKVRAYTEAGPGQWSEEKVIKTFIGVPDVPKNFRNTSTTNTSIYLEWDELDPSTGPIVNYMVWCDPCERQQINTTDVFLNITDLRPFKEYAMKVGACTAAGPGQWSEERVIKTLIGVPDVPRNFRNTSTTNTSIYLEWDELEPSTGPIVNYTVWCDLCEMRQISTTDVFLNITGLQPYKEYKMKVGAYTAAGPGMGSEEKVIKTLIGVPDVPRNFSNISWTNTSIYLEWDELDPSTGPIVNYTVSCDPCQGRERNTTDAFLNITGLQPYTQHRVKVRAYTEAGPGFWSEERVIETLIGVPHAPKTLRNDTVTNETAYLYWEEPTPSTGPVTNYSLYWRTTPRNSGCVNTKSNSSFFQTKGLLPFVNYTFWVKAVTEAGEGESSNELLVQTDIGVPTVPLNLTVDSITSVSATLSWNHSMHPNAPDIQYNIEWNMTSSTAVINSEYTQSMTPGEQKVHHTIYNLLSYTNYSARVSAITRAGQGPWTTFLPFQTRSGVPKPAVFTKVTPLEGRRVRVEWMTSGNYPGSLNYSLQAWKIPGPCSDRSREYQAKEITGAKSRDQWTEPHSDIVTGLSPFGNYWFEIMLFTPAIDGIHSKRSKDIQIAPEAAEEPMDVTADCRFSSTQARISWKPPRESNGNISSYVVEYVVENVMLFKELRVYNMCKGQSLVLTGLRPEQPYAIHVYARVEGVLVNGRKARLKEDCILPAGVPYLGNTSRVIAKGSGPDHLVLEWNEDAFSDFMGRLVQYAVLIGREESLGNSTGGKVAVTGPPWSNFSAGLSNFYQATPSWWNPFSGGSDPLECVIFTESAGDSNKTILRCFIGIQTYCPDNETYCNGPLEPDTQYEIKIRGFTEGGYNETDPVLARTGLLLKNIPVGTIVSVIFLLLLLGFLGGGGYVAKKKGYLEPITEAIQSRFRLTRKCSKSNIESMLQQMGQYSLPRPVKYKDFDDHIRIMMTDSHLKFSQEFELLKNESPHPPCTVAEMDENRCKNRWVNIFPFDHSRVKLLPLSDEPGSDFINANYIPGFTSRREYIASQGPLPNTVDDFWRMTWEQSVSVVVILTQCVERGKKKCEQYWPDSGETKYYGDLSVTSVSESILSSYVIRIFLVQLGSYKRRVKQIHFMHWPDFGCPESSDDLINFVRAVRDHLPRQEPGPIMIHCSAGVGRTGTFIAVDRLSQQLRASSASPANDTVDIYATVLDLRNHRTNMVQTEDQYIYIHLCVGQLLRERDAPRLEGCEELIYSNGGSQRDTGV